MLFLIIIGYSDWKTRTIPNKFVLFLLILLLPTIIKNFHIIVLIHFLGILILGFLLFLAGVMGAGDIKLLAVISLAVKPAFFLLFLFSITSMGGVLAIGYLIYGYCTDINKVRARGIPYGLPIVLSAAWALFVSIH
ncbi:prepilin peptidase [Vibrio neonatus]|uniref:prepilin peptidase n=1 Tax=Vibrio neonatus TaxID=278860 RepID=UPI0036F43D4A